jgi:Tol biopolymer transport system component/pimeloyl-ACP methyl ester carboxylesterase
MPLTMNRAARSHHRAINAKYALTALLLIALFSVLFASKANASTYFDFRTSTGTTISNNGDGTICSTPGMSCKYVVINLGQPAAAIIGPKYYQLSTTNFNILGGGCTSGALDIAVYDDPEYTKFDFQFPLAGSGTSPLPGSTNVNFNVPAGKFAQLIFGCNINGFQGSTIDGGPGSYQIRDVNALLYSGLPNLCIGDTPADCGATSVPSIPSEPSLVQLTNFPGETAKHPNWSPKGDFISYISNQGSGNGRMNDVWAVAPDGSNPHQLTAMPDDGFEGGTFEAFWIGSTGDLVLVDVNILYEWLRLQLSANPPLPVPRTTFDGPSPNYQELLTIPGGLGGLSFAVSQDGQNAAWSTMTSSSCPWITNAVVAPFGVLNGQATTSVGSFVTSGSFGCNQIPKSEAIVGISFSPDASQLVLARALDPNAAGYDLEIYTAGGQFVRRLTNNGTGPSPVLNLSPSWSSDGRIAFASNQTGRSEIYTINSDGLNLTKVTTNGGEWPTWSPDSSKLAFQSTRSGNSEIYTVAIGSPVQLTGTITVSTNNAAATFTITGPQTFSGSGISATFRNVSAGKYTATFGLLPGYATPAAQTLSLNADDTITFNGAYVGGTITITSNLPSATFTLTPSVPNSPTSGPYPVMLANEPASQYTLTFNAAAGYRTPSPSTQTLTIGGSVMFTGTYSLLPQVLIVPGILGTKLSSQDDTAHCPPGDASCVQWLSNSKIAFSKIESILGIDALPALQYDSSGQPITPLVTADVLNFIPAPTGKTFDLLDCGLLPGGCTRWQRNIDVYNSLRDRLQLEGFLVRSFPYDWRQDLGTLSDQLYAAVLVGVRQHPQQPVALIAHSMGGLVVSEMLNRHPDVASSLSNLVTLGTPFGGSLEAYLQLQGWESLEPFLSTTGTKELGQYWASPYFLLPQEAFVKDMGGNLISSQTTYQGGFMPDLFPALVRQVTPPLTSFGNLGGKSLAIIGSGKLTPTTIQVLNSLVASDSTAISISDSCRDYLYDNGDGTVSTASAANALSGIGQRLFVQEGHALLPSNSSIQDAIVSFLATGSVPATNGPLQDKPFPPPIFWDSTVCSPADLSAQTSSGQIVANGLVQVEGAHYISSSHGTQITLPATDPYDLTIQGTGVGTFTIILIERDTTNTVLRSIAFANVPVAPAMTGSIRISPTGPVGPLQLTIGRTTITIDSGTQPSASDDLKLLSAILSSLQLPNGTMTSLMAKLAAASDDLAREDTNGAAGAINAFTNEVRAQAGKKIPATVASGLVSAARGIADLLSSRP